jgi:hypothetical protein
MGDMGWGMGADFEQRMRRGKHFNARVIRGGGERSTNGAWVPQVLSTRVIRGRASIGGCTAGGRLGAQDGGDEGEPAMEKEC